MADDPNAQRGDHHDHPFEDDAEAAPLSTIVPVRQQVVYFYGDTIVAVQTAEGVIYVPMRPLVEGMNLTWPGQRRAIYAHPVLKKHARNLEVLTDGGPQVLMALPLKFLPGWLFRLDTGRIRADLQPLIARYQEEAFEVLAAAFLEPPSPAPDLSPARQALATLEAQTALARQQVELEERQNKMAQYMRGFIKDTRSHQRQTDERLAALELSVGPEAKIDDGQAAEISGLVELVAERLRVRNGGEGNFYGTVYRNFHDRFGITKYTNLKRALFETACAWLKDWDARLERDIAKQNHSETAE